MTRVVVPPSKFHPPKLTFELFSSSDALDNDRKGEDGDDDGGGGGFDHCTVSATVLPGGDMPRHRVATLRMTAITKSRVDLANFREEIQEDILHVQPLACGLLDPYGDLKTDVWGRRSPNAGTGVWDSEFGAGILVYIEHIHVEHYLRGMGIGTKLFNQALDWVSKKERELNQELDDIFFDGVYLVVAPGALDQDTASEFGEAHFFTGNYGKRQGEVDASKNKLTDKAVAFWRKQGFRRVGLSCFWAYATNPHHPSRQLTTEEDAKRDNIIPPELDEIDDIDDIDDVMDLLF